MDVACRAHFTSRLIGAHMGHPLRSIQTQAFFLSPACVPPIIGNGRCWLCRPVRLRDLSLPDCLEVCKRFRALVFGFEKGSISYGASRDAFEEFPRANGPCPNEIFTYMIPQH